MDRYYRDEDRTEESFEELEKLRQERARRRRTRMENRISRKAFFFQFFLLLLIGVFLLVGPRSKQSNIEKRELAKFPSFSLTNWFSGAFTAGIVEFYDDTVPFRDTLKNIGNNIRALFGLHLEDGVEVIGNINKVDPSPTSPVASASSQSTAGSSADYELKPDKPDVTPPPQSITPVPQEEEEEPLPENLRDYTAEEAEGAVENGILIVNQDGHWRGLQLFGGGNADTIASGINHLRASVDASVRMYVMPVPISSEYYLPANFTDYAASQEEFFQEIYERLEPGIEAVDIINTLRRHQEEEIFLRTDHHWQPLGAYYATQAFAKTAKVPFTDLKNYDVEERPGFVGSIYGFSKSAKILNDPETFVLYYPKTQVRTDYYDRGFNYNYTGDFFAATDVANSYLSFMLGDDKIVKVTTPTDNDRKLLIIKDSYGNAEVSFLFDSFEQIYVTDSRYFEINLVEFVKQMGITDILVTEDVYSMAGPSAGNIEIMVSQGGAVPADGAPAEGS